MVDYGSGPVKESIDNTVFIFPGIIVICLVFYWYSISPKFGVYLCGAMGAATAYQSVGPEFQYCRDFFHEYHRFLILISFFAYKLFKSLREKEKAKEEKKKMKQQRKEKEQQKKQKKKL